MKIDLVKGSSSPCMLIRGISLINSSKRNRRWAIDDFIQFFESSIEPRKICLNYFLRGCAPVDPPAVADPGFPEEGAPTPRWGRQPIIWFKISRKLHENEIIWTQREGAHVPGAPLRSATRSGCPLDPLVLTCSYSSPNLP